MAKEQTRDVFEGKDEKSRLIACETLWDLQERHCEVQTKMEPAYQWKSQWEYICYVIQKENNTKGYEEVERLIFQYIAERFDHMWNRNSDDFRILIEKDALGKAGSYWRVLKIVYDEARSILLCWATRYLLAANVDGKRIQDRIITQSIAFIKKSKIPLWKYQMMEFEFEDSKFWADPDMKRFFQSVNQAVEQIYHQYSVYSRAEFLRGFWVDIGGGNIYYYGYGDYSDDPYFERSVAFGSKNATEKWFFRYMANEVRIAMWYE